MHNFNQNNQPPTKLPFYQKTALIIFGIFLAVVILEIGLRLGGFVLLSIQEHRNRVSISKKGSYRIMCLGESTTAGQYPPFLHEILNKRNIGIKFSVIDKGLPGKDTNAILSRLEYNLDTYHPDMVITMMGINDCGAHMPYESISDSKAINFLKSFRTYKLSRFLWLHIVTTLKDSNQPKFSSQKFELKQAYKEDKEVPPGEVLLKCKKAIELNPKGYEAYIELGNFYLEQGEFTEAEELFKKAIELSSENRRGYFELGKSYREQDIFPGAEELFKKAIALNPENDKGYILLGKSYREQDKFPEAEESYRRAIELNPKNDEAYILLGDSCRNQGKFPEAEESYRRAIELNPKGYEAYIELGNFYLEQGKFPEAEDSYRRAIELNAENYRGYFELGKYYREQDKFPEAEELFKKAIALNPENDKGYILLGNAYREQDKFPEAEASYRRAIELNPKNDEAYIELSSSYLKQDKFPESEASYRRAIELNAENYRGYFELGKSYLEQDKFPKAEELFKKAIERNPGDDRAYEALELLHLKMGNPGLASEYGKKAREIRLSYYNPTLTGNYHKLKTILDKRGITYVCMQYPIRNLEPLKKIFQGDTEGIIFVDNEKIFKDVLKKAGYREYFKDIFASDFGHCTVKGNRLLAENIANTILRELFNK